MGKKSKKTTTQTVYGNTSTINPYVTSQTTNGGTVSAFQSGSALESINNFVNNNIGKLLDEYLNPTLNSVTNQSKMNSYMNALSGNSARTLENDIINPLSNRNMLRSSQATNLYNNLLRNNTSQISNYAQELLANSQKDTATMLSTLLMLYLNGYNVLSDTQRQSLATSQGNAQVTGTSGGSGIDLSPLSQMVNAAVLGSI